ncbi:hypothetical protein JYA52_02390 [Arthrobacter pascens]|nr:hypothetical protein [Arthrobacter pascens]
MHLTRILQTAFGWCDEHLHRYTAADPTDGLSPWTEGLGAP